MDIDELLSKGATTAAKGLLGWRLYAEETDGSLTGGMIAETEAYTEEDAASHTHRGRTARNAAMFGPAGHTYVYFTYGNHWCVNIVTGRDGHGEGVLIRALLPDKNLDVIRNRRGNRPDKLLTNGPGKVCQALGITGADYGLRVNSSRIKLLPPAKSKISHIATERIGISRDTHRLWRFVLEP